MFFRRIVTHNAFNIAGTEATQIGKKYGLVALINWFGFTAETANAYMGKTELRKMEIE